jgi:hypothetical protein
MAEDWAEVLDILEARVEAHRRVLLGEQTLSGYELPDDVGPLPIELVGRACAVLARQREVEDEIAGHMAAMRTLFRPAPTVPIYFDKSA